MQIKFLKREKHFKKGGIGTDPNFFWNILLFLALFIMIISLVFSFLLFRRINRESILPLGDISGKSETVDKERIKKILQYFSDKKNKSTEILNSPAPVKDPSF